MFNILLIQIVDLHLFKYKNAPNKQTPQASRSPGQNQNEKFPSQKCNFQETLGYEL